MQIPNIYANKNYKFLIIIPLIFVILALFYIPKIKLGVDFKGGVQIEMNVEKQINEEEVKSAIEKEGFKVLELKILPFYDKYRVIIQLGLDENITKVEELKSEFYSKIDEVSRLESEVVISNNSQKALEKYTKAREEINEIANQIFSYAKMEQNASHQELNELKNNIFLAYNNIKSDFNKRLNNIIKEKISTENEPKIQDISATVSANFVQKATFTVIISTILVSIVVFLIFRTIIPSFAVLIGAACDIIIALGAMGFFGIPLTLASFAALLMLVGFSLDTDILLTMRVVKRKENEPKIRAFEAFKTGTTMSLALMLSFICLFVLSLITHIGVYYEISTVAIAGLIGDMIATWGLNAVIVLAYMEKKEGIEESSRIKIFSD
jgi:preprotein translocase subunit SecF